MLIGSTVVYRGQFGAARPGAARVRVVMYVAGMGCFRVVDGDGDGVPAVGDGDNGGVWSLGGVGRKEKRRIVEMEMSKSYLLTSRRGRSCFASVVLRTVLRRP